MPQAGTRPRLQGLDAIRGVAAMIVALRHVSFLNPAAFPESFLAVDLFFVLSGVVLCDAYEPRFRAGLTCGSFMKARIIRLYPLYLLGTMVGLLALAMAPTSPHAATSFVLALGMVPSAGSDLFPLNLPAWSLLFELVASFAYGLYARVATTRVLLAIVAGSGACLALISIARTDHSLDIGWTFGSLSGGLARVAFSFSVGLILRRRLDRRRPVAIGGATRMLGSCVLLAAIALILTATSPGCRRSLFELGAIFVAFPAIVYAMLRLDIDRKRTRVFETLGAISYPLYALHEPAAELLERLGPRLGVDLHDLASWSGLAFMIALGGVSLWLEQAFDRPLRARLTRLFKGLAEPRLAPAAS